MENTNDPFRLKPVWAAILNIYDIFEAICLKHGLRYYVYFGSAIGAVRNNGFIPWDDDLDVAMPRDDYTMFREIAERELPSYLKYIDWRNTPTFFPNAFGKIQDTRKDYIEQIESFIGRKLPQGLYLDIFPLDGAPKGLFENITYWPKLLALISAGSSFYGVRKAPTFIKFLWRGLGWLFARAIFNARSKQDLYWRFEAISMKYPFEKGRKCGGIILPARVVLSGMCDYEAFGRPKMISFCGREVPLPSDYDAILKALYGDYMKLPPESERHIWHGSLETAPWKFG